MSGTLRDLGVPESVVAAARRMKVTEPTPIQSAVIPDALAGRNILGKAPTGTGKTLAFLIPMVSRLLTGHSVPGRPRGLVVVPTRELADQIGDVVADLGAARGLRSLVFIGGEKINKQKLMLAATVDVVVTTPGRALQLLREKAFSLDDVSVAVIDEADEMADLGFLPDVTGILRKVPKSAQRMLFSATLDDDVEPLIRLVPDPVRHEVTAKAQSKDLMTHLEIRVREDEDADAVIPWIASRDGRTVLFVSAKTRVAQVCGLLTANGVNHGYIHGDRGQTARRDALADFASGRCPVLVATDVAARGLDIASLDLVVHVDPPADAATYVHRSGRTARAGATGTVATLVRQRQIAATERVLAQVGVTPKIIEVNRPTSPELRTAIGAKRPVGRKRPEKKPETRQAGTARHRGGPRKKRR